MRMRTIVLGLLALLTAALLTSATARDSATGTFNASMQFGSAANGSQPMKFNGQLAWAKPKLRLDLTEQTTKEKMVVLVDFNGGDATLLYPDTLNGIKTKLPAMDTAGYIQQFQHLLSSGGSSMAKGWKKEKVASEKVGSTAATKFKVTGPAGEQVYWWLDGNNKPLKVQTAKGNANITLNFGDLKFGAEVPAKTFTYGKQYSVIEMKAEDAKKMVPGGA
jgi:outer membrane lipoprotein-sorting protein